MTSAISNSPLQIMDYQRFRSALAAGRVGSGPVISNDMVTGIERPRRAYRGLKVLLRWLPPLLSPLLSAWEVSATVR
jgi:hypothetical protein